MIMYRRKALSRLDAPEQLDEAVRLATVPGWLTTVVLLLVVAGAAGWAGTATVPRTVDALGLITHSAGVSRLYAPVGGLVTRVAARVGQRAAKGTPLYALTAPNGVARFVRAPWDGFVTSWLAREGQFLQPGTTVGELVRLDTPGDRLQARVYLRASFAGVVGVGMPVEMDVDSAPAKAFGTLKGVVAAVGQFPETEDSLRAFLGDSAVVPRLLASGSVVAVTVMPALDTASTSGLRWSGSGPPFQLASQSEVTARMTVAVEHPINWLVGR